MATRIIVAVIFAPILFVILFFLPPVFLAVTVAGIAALASFELLRATGAEGRKSLCTCTALAAALTPFGYLLEVEGWWTRLLALALMCCLFWIAIRSYGGAQSVALGEILACMFGGAAIPNFLSALVQLKGMEHGRYLVLLPVIVAFLTDAGAYFAGVFLGRHRGITQVSPNKSLEGYIGGILSGVAFMLLYAAILRTAADLEVRLLPMVVYGVVGSAVTELGDLAFSLIKRQYGVKDYGHLLPGHGGMLDRFDSMIFAAPTLWVLVTVFPAF